MAYRGRQQEQTSGRFLRSGDNAAEYQSTCSDVKDRKLAEERLRESEVRFRGTFENAAVGMAHVTLDGRWLEVNDLLCTITGYAREELLAKAFEDITYPEDLAADLENMRNLLAGEIPNYSINKRYIRKDGSIVWIALTVALQRDTLGAPQYFISVVRDINSQKLAERALSASEERLAQAVAVAKIGIFESDAASHAVTVSSVLRKMLGFDANGEITLGRVAERILPEDRAIFLERVARARDPAGDGTAAGEYRILHPNHGIRWLTHRVQAFFEGEGAARHWVRSIGAVQDITERKLAEQALRLNEERFRTIITTAQEGIWAIDREAKTLFANPRMAELLGMLPEDMIGKPVTEFCFPADVFGARDRMAANFAGEKTQFEFRFRRSDGTPLHVLAATAPLGGPSGEVIGALGGFIDLTERKAAEDHQRFLMRELSHRSKNLLTVIQAIASQTVRSAASLADFQERFLQRLQGIAASHDVLVSQNWGGAPLAELVRRQVGPFAAEARVQLDGPDVSLSPQAAQALGLALHELATNCLKYGALSRPEGWVRITWLFECNDSETRWLRLDWREHGGPAVEPPARKGLGHDVIERMVAHSLDGTVVLDFAPEGFRWSVSFPTTHLVNRAKS